MKARGTKNGKGIGKMQIIQLMQKCVKMQQKGKYAKLKNWKSKNAPKHKMHRNRNYAKDKIQNSKVFQMLLMKKCQIILKLKKTSWG